MHRDAHRLTLGLLWRALALLAAGLSVMAWVPLPTWAAFLLGLAGFAAGYYLWIRRWLNKALQPVEQALNELKEGKFERVASRTVAPSAPLAETLGALRRLAAALKALHTRWERLETYRRDFLGDVSHELKTPIFAIQGFVETLMEGALEDPTVNRAFLEKIHRNTLRLHALVRDLMEITRLETGELTLRQAPFALEEVIRRTVDTLEPLARERTVTLEVDLEPHLPPVLGDAARIGQVLMNLVDNAIKYNRPGGKVILRARRHTDRRVYVAVEDTGIGIPEEAIPRLTERFFRVDRSRSRAQGGTGLGLSIVKHILEGHRSRLHVQSREGEGSRFSFTLHIAEQRSL